MRQRLPISSLQWTLSLQSQPGPILGCLTFSLLMPIRRRWQWFCPRYGQVMMLLAEIELKQYTFGEIE